MKEIQIKVSACVCESLTNSEIPSSNFLQRAFLGFLIAACLKKLFRNPPVILKIVPKASYVPLKKSTTESKGKPEHKFYAASGQFLEIVSVFKEAIKNFILIFRFQYVYFNIHTNKVFTIFSFSILIR